MTARSLHPLYDALVAKAQRGEARFHMPGHKGVPVLGVAPEAIDFTELSDTGDLYSSDDDIIRAAEDLAARDYASNGCVFSAGGATLCIQGALAAAAGYGGHVLAARDAHRSFYHALALLDGNAEFVRAGAGADEYDAALERGKFSVVYLTSPDYYGFCTDVDNIYNVCKRHGVPLVVDAAHGAHLEWLGKPVRGDYVVMSAHKTLCALGGAAMLHTYGAGSAPLARRFMRVFGSSSPSYLILASLDRALGLMRGGSQPLRVAAARVAALTEEFNVRLNGDPLRLVIPFCDGFRAARELEEMGIVPEMADARSVVFIVTAADGEEQFERLRTALNMYRGKQRSPDRLLQGYDAPSNVPIPERVTTIRAAVFGATEGVILRDAGGRVAAESIAPYPPGVPVVAPGEKISCEAIAFLEQMLYNVDIEVRVLCKSKGATA